MPAAPSPSRACCARRNIRPSTELQAFIARKPTPRVLRHDVALNNVHWVETRRPQPDSLMALAIDHRIQLEAIADRLGAPRERIGRFKELAVEATARVADGRPGYRHAASTAPTA